jgi:hypothetical protein
MTGTASQIEWAEQIKPCVDAEFTRVRSAFDVVAKSQREEKRIETSAIIAILEEKRAEVMSNEHAGYFFRDWRELSDQVRRMIGQDERYLAIKAKRS